MIRGPNTGSQRGARCVSVRYDADPSMCLSAFQRVKKQRKERKGTGGQGLILGLLMSAQRDERALLCLHSAQEQESAQE